MTYRAITAVGVEEATAMFAEIGLRLENMEMAAPVVNQLLSIHFIRKWENWHGYLYDTGRLQRSWTSVHRTTDALRRAHRDEIEYGSSVPYGRFYEQQILGDVDARGGIDITEAMADYYAGVRAVSGHRRGQSMVRSYLREAHR